MATYEKIRYKDLVLFATKVWHPNWESDIRGIEREYMAETADIHTKLFFSYNMEEITAPKKGQY